MKSVRAAVGGIGETLNIEGLKGCESLCKPWVRVHGLCRGIKASKNHDYVGEMEALSMRRITTQIMTTCVPKAFVFAEG